jgi:IS5 family transposase
MFADLYSSRGRRSIAPRVMATVMVLQRFEGLSDSEAVDRLHFDLRYKWACGLAYDAPSFDSTLLVDMRARLRKSGAPDRIFLAVLNVAKKVRCPAGVRVSLHMLKDGSRFAEFGGSCAECPLRSQCTKSKSGRTIKLHPKHETLDRHRKHQRDEAWKKRYRKVRPRVERKLAHLMRRKHGGRRARVRGRERVKQDFALLAASINLARLAALGVRIAPAARAV